MGSVRSLGRSWLVIVDPSLDETREMTSGQVRQVTATSCEVRQVALTLGQVRQVAVVGSVDVQRA